MESPWRRQEQHMSNRNDNTARSTLQDGIIELGVASIETRGGVENIEPMGPGEPPGPGIAND